MGSLAVGLLGVVSAFAAPQGTPSAPQAAVVTGALHGGRLRLDAFGLGEGGVRAERLRPVVAPGDAVTSGGVRVRARDAGMKLDFPGGAELLVSPTGRVHLRDGEQTLPCFGGVQILLADGAIVRAWPQSGLRGALRCVEVEVEGATHVLWQQDQAVAEASFVRRFAGLTLCALGDGSWLYRPTPIGPIVVLERVLVPREARASAPPVVALVVGDVLRDSLQRLPDHAPQRSVQFPDLHPMAVELASLAPQLFADGVRARPPGALGALVIPLADDWRVQVSVHPAMLTIGLSHGAGATPCVEWTIALRTEVRFVRPDAGVGGGPRYMLGGLDVGQGLRELLPVQPTSVELERAKRLLVQLGGSPVQALAPQGDR